MKKLIPIIILLICGFVSCNTNSNDPVEILKQKINKAEMVEYVDTIYGAKLLYPDFFKVDSVGRASAFFSYSDENVKILNFEYYISPPRLFDSTKEAVRFMTSNPLATSSEVKTGSFIITEEYENFPHDKCVSKYYKTKYGWASYSLTYEKEYEDAVKRLIKMVKDWKVYDDNVPEWFTDMCDFFDI